MVNELGVETPENLKYTYLGKIQVLEGPMQLPPHKCAVCGRALVSNTDKYIDWCFDVEFYGQVAFCTDCFLSAANQLGYMAPDQWESVMTERHQMFGRIEELMEQNKRLSDALASLGLVGIPVDNSLVSPLGSNKVSEANDGGASGNAPFSDGDSEGNDSAEPKSDGSTSSKGSPELHGDDTLNELIAGI